MDNLSFDNIFELIAEDKAEAADMKFRADILLVMRKLFEKKGWTQPDIMLALDIPQPRASELVTGKYDKFSSDKLIGYMAKLGFQFRPSFSDQGIPVQCTVSVGASC